jgi:hypothetical protein
LIHARRLRSSGAKHLREEESAAGNERRELRGIVASLPESLLPPRLEENFNSLKGAENTRIIRGSPVPKCGNFLTLSCPKR